MRWDLGALWGWLPCGLVYSVLLTALASGSAPRGALIMLAFGLGTLPNLLAIGLFWESVKGWVQSPRVRLIGRAAGGGCSACMVWSRSDTHFI